MGAPAVNVTAGPIGALRDREVVAGARDRAKERRDGELVGARKRPGWHRECCIRHTAGALEDRRRTGDLAGGDVADGARREGAVVHEDRQRRRARGARVGACVGPSSRRHGAGQRGHPSGGGATVRRIAVDEKIVGRMSDVQGHARGNRDQPCVGGRESERCGRTEVGFDDGADRAGFASSHDHDRGIEPDGGSPAGAVLARKQRRSCVVGNGGVARFVTCIQSRVIGASVRHARVGLGCVLRGRARIRHRIRCSTAATDGEKCGARPANRTKCPQAISFEVQRRQTGGRIHRAQMESQRRQPDRRHAKAEHTTTQIVRHMAVDRHL